MIGSYSFREPPGGVTGLIGNMSENFKALGLCDELLRAIAGQGYTAPTPIQEQAIPPILEGKDVMGAAQTGTGKTAAFTLPLLQRLKPHANTSFSPARHPVRALILTPTRELAAQVEESVRDYGKYIPLRCTLIFGGVNMDPQIQALRSGVEILVATPGRLLDHAQQRTVSFPQVEVLVLDEADRMLDMGFLPDIKRILSLLPPGRQNLLFSATFSEDVMRLAGQLLNAPVRVEVARRNAPAELVAHIVYLVSQERKQALLIHLLRTEARGQTLVFTRTKLGANRLARQLERAGIACAAIHSDRTQAERTKALDDFKKGLVEVLVATDIAARGLDIEALPCVVNFELPHAAEDYVHRIGRTGRAGASGLAISLASGEEEHLLGDVERLLKIALPRRPTPLLDEPKQPRSSQSREAGRDGRIPHRPRSPRLPADDIFSRPYEAGDKSAPSGPVRHARKSPGKPIPALFLPPAPPASSEGGVADHREIEPQH